MAVSKVKAPDSTHQLMIEIGETIRRFTTHTPMTHEHIVGVLGFTCGAAIARGVKGRSQRRQMREMGIANIDLGLDAMTSSMANSSLILPDSVA